MCIHLCVVWLSVTHVTGAFMHVFAVCGVVYVNVCCLGANLIVCEHRHNHIETA